MDRIARALELARQRQQPAPSLQQDTFVDGQEVVHKEIKTVQPSQEILRENRIISSFQQESLVDSYRVLRTHVLRRMKQNNWRSLGVTSAAPGVGKTLTAINLSISIVMDPNCAVILVDADLRRPNIHKFLGLKPEHSIGDYINTEIAIEDLLINPGIERLVILPSQKQMKNSSDFIASPNMVHLIQDLKSRYSSYLMIFDLPPVLVGDDVIAVASLLDAALLVVEDGKTKADELARSVELLKDVNIVGTVLNKSTEGSHGYDYT
jgi:capsular exopolysaccharide synthesis family protein